MNKEPFSKFHQVYSSIPDDGTPIRFNEIVNKLRPMSRSTVANALKHGTIIGLLECHRKSKKCVEYRKPLTKTISPTEHIKAKIKEYSDVGVIDAMDVVDLYINNFRRNSIKDVFTNIKKSGDVDVLLASQAVFLKNQLEFIDNHIENMLLEYLKTPNKQDAKNNFSNKLEFTLKPLIKQLMDDIDGAGIENKKVLTAVSLCKRAKLKKEYFDNHKN